MPVLYKLFCPFTRSPTTHARRPPNCLTKQAADQATPRRTICTHSTKQGVAECHWTHWDEVEHNRKWRALREQGIEEPYVQVLSKLYDRQQATVRTDVRSNRFSLEGGTKQGDPLCTLSFNALLQHIMKPPMIEKWNRKNRGIGLVKHDRNVNFSNSRCAGDIPLIFGSPKCTPPC